MQTALPSRSEVLEKGHSGIWKISQDFRGKVRLSTWPSWSATGAAVAYLWLQVEVGTR